MICQKLEWNVEIFEMNRPAYSHTCMYYWIAVGHNYLHKYLLYIVLKNLPFRIVTSMYDTINH